MKLTDYDLDERTVGIIDNITESGRLPHAVILEGGGENALKLAAYLSAFAVCAAEKKPCGECKGCVNALNKTHADIKYVSPDSSRKSKTLSINQLRELSKDTAERLGLKGIHF